MDTSPRPAVLFLCTQNACRSQMAEGWLRALGGDRFEALSAGLQPSEVNPMAIKVMADAGIDIREQTSKSIKGILGEKFISCAIFVCSAAEENCPNIYPFAQSRLSWPFEDPATFQGTEEERYRKFVEARDLIGQRIREWLDTQGSSTGSAEMKTES